MVEPELIEPEVEPAVPELVEPDVEPVVPELEPVVPDVEPGVPELIEFVLPEVPVLLVVALPDELGVDVEPEFTEPLLLLTPGPELAAEEVPPVELPLVPVPPVPPLDWAYDTAATAPMATAAAMERVREVDMMGIAFR